VAAGKELLAYIDIGEMAGAFVRTSSVRLKVRDQVQEIALSTEGWEEARDAWKAKNPQPKPPYVDTLVREGSPEARRFGVSDKRVTSWRKYDEADVGFLQARDRWLGEAAYAVAAHCLKLELKSGGVPITSPEERVAGLKRLGMTVAMAQGIAAEVVRLSQLEAEEATDFFDEPSESTSS
jgi:hypothetical protein